MLVLKFYSSSMQGPMSYFQNVGFKECATLLLYQPHHSDIKKRQVKVLLDKLLKYEVYTKCWMENQRKILSLEAKAKFIKEPSKMKLLIVVDKL
jgi:type I restriction enzyme R subunit